MNIQKKTIIGAGLALLILGGLVWIAKPAPSEPNTAAAGNAGTGALTTGDHTFDFGTISMAAGNVNHAFAIKNTGSAPIVIKKMYTSCMCTTATLKTGGASYGPFGMPGHGSIPAINANIAPGEAASVEAIFDPAAHGPAGVGKIERVVRLEPENGEALEFHFTAFVTP